MPYHITTWSDPALGRSTLQPKANFPPEIAASYGNTLPNGMRYGVGFAFLVPAGFAEVAHQLAGSRTHPVRRAAGVAHRSRRRHPAASAGEDRGEPPLLSDPGDAH